MSKGKTAKRGRDFDRIDSTMFESIHFESTGRKTTNASKPEVLEKLRALLGEENVVVDPDRVEPYGADAVKEKFPPEAVVFPESTREMVAILKLANEYLFPVTARGGVLATRVGPCQLTAESLSELTG